MRRYRKFCLIYSVCVAAAILGSLVGILKWIFAIAYLIATAMIVGNLVFLEIKSARNQLGGAEKQNLLLTPTSALIVYFYIFLWPWTSLPLEYDSFTRLAPSDRPAALILRAVLCLVAYLISLELTKQIVWKKREKGGHST